MQYGNPITPQTVKAGYGFIDNGIIEKNLYFYHPDHLGSSSYITDREGRITQHTEYIAFGEVLFEEHSTSKTMPYLFNGKELDTETGLYYYGARYYDPRVSIFLNVDPLAEKTMTPYAYTNNNPINLIDPTGMASEDPPVKKLTGSKNLLIYINEKNVKTDAEVMKKEAGKFDFIAVDNINEVQKVLTDHYGKNIARACKRISESHTNSRCIGRPHTSPSSSSSIRGASTVSMFKGISRSGPIVGNSFTPLESAKRSWAN